MSKLKEAIEYYDIFLENHDSKDAKQLLTSAGFNVIFVDTEANMVGIEGISNPLDIFQDMGYRRLDGDYCLVW